MPDMTHPISNILNEGYAKEISSSSSYNSNLGVYITHRTYRVLKPMWCTDSVPYSYQSHQAYNSHDHDSYSTAYKTIYVPYTPGMTATGFTNVGGHCYPPL